MNVEINRIKSDAPPLTIKEYEERYLGPARERLCADLAKQLAEDAAFWGWKREPWWKRTMIWLRLAKASPSVWPEQVRVSPPAIRVRLPSDFKVVDRTPLA